MTPEKIREARHELGLTRREFAEALGVARRTVISWELPSQRRRPSKAVLKQLERLQDYERLAREIRAAGQKR